MLSSLSFSSLDELLELADKIKAQFCFYWLLWGRLPSCSMLHQDCDWSLCKIACKLLICSLLSLVLKNAHTFGIDSIKSIQAANSGGRQYVVASLLFKLLSFFGCKYHFLNLECSSNSLAKVGIFESWKCQITLLLVWSNHVFLEQYAFLWYSFVRLSREFIHHLHYQYAFLWWDCETCYKFIYIKCCN